MQNSNLNYRNQNFDSGPTFWIVLISALAMQLIAYDQTVNLYDEGIILTGADSVFRGKLPYKDFWTMYGPGSFYLASFLFSVFEPSDFLVRAIGIISKSTIVALIFLSITRLANKSLALAGSAIILGMLIELRQDAFPVFPAIALALGAIIFLEQGLDSRPKNFAAAGVCTGLAACFRHDMGFYLALAATLSIFLDFIFISPETKKKQARIIFAKKMGLYVLGILSIDLPVVGFFIHSVPLSDLYENLILIPSSIYPGMRHLPWPGLDGIKGVLSHPGDITQFVVYVPFLVCIPIIVSDIFQPKGIDNPPDSLGKSVRPVSFFLLITSCTCLLFTLKGLIRVSAIHMVQSLTLSVPLILISLSRRNWKNRPKTILILISLIPSLALLVSLSIPGFKTTKDGIKELAFSKANLITRCTNPSLPTLRCTSTDHDYINAAIYVREHTTSDDRIYVGVGRHDKIFINAVAFYFFSERQPVTKWYELHPGIQTQARIQAEMISEMENNPPKMIILDERWDKVEEPNLSKTSSGVNLLDDYLKNKYAEKIRFGPIRILAYK